MFRLITFTGRGESLSTKTTCLICTKGWKNKVPSYIGHCDRATNILCGLNAIVLRPLFLSVSVTGERDTELANRLAELSVSTPKSVEPSRID